MKLAFILFFTVFTVSGQNIVGKVLDRETNLPLEDVNIYLEDTDTGTVSNTDGEFILKFQKQPKETDFVSFSIVGYRTNNYTIAQIKALNFIIFLSKKNEQLDEVVVRSEFELQDELSYKKLSPLKEGVHHFGATLVDGKIYVIGGDKTIIEETEKKALEQAQTFDEMLKMLKAKLTWEHYGDKLQVYDINKDEVTVSDVVFEKRAYHNVVNIDHKLYVLGGKSLSLNQEVEYLVSKIEVFDLDTNTLKIDETNPHAVINFSAISYHDNIIVMGGSIRLKANRGKVHTDNSFIYNTTSGYWYELNKMTKLKEVSAVRVENKIYVIGGFYKKNLKEIESYSLETGTWQAEGNLFYGIERPALTHHDGTIYIYNNGKLLTFNVESKVLNEYKIGIELRYSEIFYADNKLYIVGGLKEYNYKSSPSKGVFSIDLKAFSRTKILRSKTL